MEHYLYQLNDHIIQNTFKTLSKNTIFILESMEDPCFNYLAYVHLTSNFAMLWIQVGILRALEGRSTLTEGPVTVIPDQYFSGRQLPTSQYRHPPPPTNATVNGTLTLFSCQPMILFKKNVVTGPTPCFTELGKHIYMAT